MRPSIDHSLLSPSGHVSKRTRNASIERMRRELFGDGLEYPKCRQPTERERLIRQAKELRALAARGMSRRAFTRQARELEDRAATMPA